MWIRFLWTLAMLGAALGAWATPANAEGRPLCVLVGGATSMADAARSVGGCALRAGDAAREKSVWLRADTRGIAPPFVFEGDNNYLDAVTIGLVGPDGSIATRRFEAADLGEQARWVATYGIELDWAPGPVDRVVVRIDGPWDDNVVEGSALWNAHAFDRVDAQRGHIVWFILGFAFVTLIGATILMTAARERTAAWLLAVISISTVYHLASTNALTMLIDLPMAVRWRMTYSGPLAVAMLIAAFVLDSLDGDALPRWLRRVWIAAAAIAAVATSFVLVFGEAIRPFGSNIHHAGFLPMSLLFFPLMGVALVRRREKALLLFVALSFFIVGALFRVIGYLADLGTSAFTDLSFHLSLFAGAGGLMIPVGQRVARYRLHGVRSARELRTTRRLAAEDALTRLGNRRAFDAAWDRGGHRALGIVDLDHFKQVNDRYGHDVGDAVLRAVSDALASAWGIEAFRFGGEEFTLLARGDGAVARLEALRTSLPRAVAAAVPLLEASQTASAGVVELDGGPISARRALALADVALYRAKNMGRDRMSVHEGDVIVARPVVGNRASIVKPFGKDERTA